MCKTKSDKESSIKKWDVITIILLLVAGVGLFAYSQNIYSKKGNTVVVTIDNKEYKKIPLDQNLELNIKSTCEKSGKNTLVVKDGFAYIKEANCPDKLCVKKGKISKKGETLVCLPHRLVISIDD